MENQAETDLASSCITGYSHIEDSSDIPDSPRETKCVPLTIENPNLFFPSSVPHLNFFLFILYQLLLQLMLVLSPVVEPYSFFFPPFFSFDFYV